MKIDDRRLLPARAAEGDVEIAVAVVGGAVDVVHAGDERRADLDERRFAGQLVDADGGRAAFEPFGDDDASARSTDAEASRAGCVPTRTCGAAGSTGNPSPSSVTRPPSIAHSGRTDGNAASSGPHR